MRRSFLIILALLLCAAPTQAQTTGTLIPSLPGQYLDSSGNVCSGCLLYSYTAGSTSLLATYSDSALTVPNANPIVLNAAGVNPAGGIYLTATSYKFVLKTAAGSTIWTRDNVAAIPYTTIASTQNSICDGRLTLTTATPVTSGDVTAATSVRWTPYKGNRCALYDGTTWNITSFSELSIALGSDAANTNYDVFLYLSSGSPALERVAWTNDTTRATAITLQDGVYVKSGDTGRRYLGTYRTTAVAGQTEDSGSKRFVWNYYNRVARYLRVRETTDSWTYTTATLRQANNSVSNQIAVVIGVAENSIRIQTWAYASNTGANVLVATSIGEDSTTAVATGVVGMAALTQVANQAVAATSYLDKTTDIGYHYYALLEFSAATGTTTWYGDNGNAVTQTGIFGTIVG